MSAAEGTHSAFAVLKVKDAEQFAASLDRQGCCLDQSVFRNAMTELRSVVPRAAKALRALAP